MNFTSEQDHKEHCKLHTEDIENNVLVIIDYSLVRLQFLGIYCD